MKAFSPLAAKPAGLHIHIPHSAGETDLILHSSFIILRWL
jgi:hypothetical protein